MLRFVITLLVALSIYTPISADERRLALVLANQDYPASIGSLSGTHADAERISAALEAVGFEVFVELDKDSSQTLDVITDFELAINEASRQGDDVVAFFYASMHGASASLKNENANFLIPAKTEVRTPGELMRKGIRLDHVAEGFKSSGAKTVFVVSDACRNELEISFTKGGTKGFERVSASAGVLMAYATAPGATTPDDGLFSTILAEEIQKAGRRGSVAILDTVERVARRRPMSGLPFFTSGGIPKTFCFNGCTDEKPISTAIESTVNLVKATVGPDAASLKNTEGVTLIQFAPYARESAYIERTSNDGLPSFQLDPYAGSLGGASGSKNPVFNVVVQNQTDESVFITSVIYRVESVTQYRGGQGGPLTPNAQYHHSILWQEGDQSAPLAPIYHIPAKGIGSFLLEITPQLEQPGLAWTMSIGLKTNSNSAVWSDKFELVMSK